MSLTNTDRANIVAIAESWYGTRFAGHSCLKGCGVDCAQFLGGVYREAGYWCGDGIVLPTEYSLQIGQHREDPVYTDTLLRYMREIPESEVLPGDVVVYQTGLSFAHGAIIKTWPTHIIHALERDGVTAGHGLDSAFGKLSRKFFTLKDIHCKGAA
jgi:hypothetical protein